MEEDVEKSEYSKENPEINLFKMAKERNLLVYKEI